MNRQYLSFRNPSLGAIVLLGFVGIPEGHAQTTLTFTANSDGTYRTLDSILVVNLTQGGDTILYAPDTVLVLDISTGVDGILPGSSSLLSIRPPYPNPFDGSTRFQVGTVEPGQLGLSVYDPTGRLVASHQQPVSAGAHIFTYTGGRQGMLFLVAEINGLRSIERMLSLSMDGGATPRITFGGSGGLDDLGSPKDLGPFNWSAGDSLKYVGYVMHAPTPLGFDSLSIRSLPVASETIPFPFVTHTDTLSAADLAILDALPDTILPPENIIIEDGLSALDILTDLDPTYIDSLGFGSGPMAKNLLSATEQKRLLFARMGAFAWYLINDANHIHGPEPPNGPAQTGLAYGYGSRFYNQREIPPGGECISESIYALDCSGMIYHMGADAGLTFPYTLKQAFVKAPYGTMRDTAGWRQALEPEYDKLRVVDMGLNLPIDSMRSGDLLIWANHIGQAYFVGPAGMQLFQSNGTNVISENCTANRGQGRGPSMKPLNAYWLSQFGGCPGPNCGVYRVLRIREKVCSGSPLIVTDSDGNTYPVVPIGDQCWLAENLRTTKYADGSPIPNVADSVSWIGLSTGAWCNYSNSFVTNPLYGKLYNGYAITDVRKVCPSGWHIPSIEEWLVLSNSLGQYAPYHLMSVGPQWGNLGDNSSGFSAQPSGGRDAGTFYGLTDGYAMWWSSTADGNNQWSRQLIMSFFGEPILYTLSRNQNSGMSVRCIKD
jgi:uncharacterized protein (TIGR02145 family)